MNDIDFIKKSVPFADFYEIKEYPKCTMISIPCFEHDNFIEDYFKIVPDYVHSHFLTKTIEGINKKHVNGMKLIQNDHEIIAMHYITDKIFNLFRIAYSKTDYRVDEAKRAAIEYVLVSEQEKKIES